MANSSALLSVRQLSYGTPSGKCLAKELSFELAFNNQICIEGPNGVGKSTLLRVLLKQQAPTSGSFSWSIPIEKIAYIPQLQNTAQHLPLTLKDVLDLTIPKGTTNDQIAQLGLLDPQHLSLAWNTASGGEKKRTLLTRALLSKAQVLILDEPFNHLDKDSKQKIKDVLAITNLAMILVSHENIGESVQTIRLKPYA